MEPVALIVAALATGAAAGVGEAASIAVQEAYQALRALITDRFSDKASAEAILSEHESDPGTWEAPLTGVLIRVGADTDPKILEAAQTLLAVASPSSKYTVDLRGSQGTVVGDRNQQINTFHQPPPPSS